MYYSTRRIIILLAFFLLAALPWMQNGLTAQTFWMQSAGGATIDQGMDVSVDGAGNTYVTGYFTSAASFGPYSVSSSGIDDVFLAKLGPNGLYLWAVKAGGINSDRALSIKSDAAGNSYITGYFYGSATFGATTLTSAGAQDVFVAKFNNAGVCQWAKSAGGSGADIGNGITVDGSGNVIVTGEFAGTSSFGSTALTSLNGSTDVFTTKLDASGNFVWAEQGSAWLTDRGLDVDCDAAGNIYVTGQFSDTITFDVQHINNMLNAVFVVKYNPSGVEQWFRKIGGGAVNLVNSIACDNTNGIYVTGDFQGTLSFFGTTTTTLGATYTNRIFIAKYDASGGLSWSVAESSDSPLTSKSITSDGTNVFVGGNFKCTFDTYNARYGVGLFNSSGYWDVFAGKYAASSGTWVMGRQLGGKQDQLCSGIAVDGSGNPHLAGSYIDELITPTSAAFYGYPSYGGYEVTPTDSLVPQGQNCADPSYTNYSTASSEGNSDIFVGNPIDPARAPYDYYFRPGSGCLTDFVGTCINLYTGLDFLCGNDTLGFCQQGQLFASTNTSYYNPASSGTGPDFTYLWSTGGTSPFINVSASGYYSVLLTTADGCYTSEDTIYIDINPSPPTPTISDNVVINNNATNPMPIVVCADSVILTGGNFGSSSVYWQGPAFYPNSVPQPSVVVDSSGSYVFIVTDANGCSVANNVLVTLDHPLVPIDPAMICLEDADFNDTIRTCENVMLTFFPYDSTSNPTANFECIDGLTQVLWTITPTGATIFPTSDCTTGYAFTFGTITATGWYTITETIIRTSSCGNDTTIGTHDFYFEVLPAPPQTPVTLTITPAVFICPGDSATLVVSGGTTYIWSTGSQNDSIVVYAPGTYYVSGSNTVTNSSGCSTTSSSIVQTTVNYAPQPNILMFPSDGLICPGDSIQLVASGVGTFVWQGPNGPVGGNTNTLYVNSPGTYYCVLTTPGGCQLLSNSVNVQQYNTPSIQASPSSVLCPGDSITISLTASSGSAVTWQPPLSGSSISQVITTPGVYSCTVLACNIATTVSITVLATSVSAVITPLTTTIVCEGDSIQLGANAGMEDYTWQPGGSTDQSIYVFDDGMYYLTTADSGSCVARDSFQVSFTPNNLVPPLGTDTTVCIGTMATLIASGDTVITWYDAPGGNIVATGPVLQANNVQATTVYYVMTDDGVCRSLPTPITIFTEDCSPQIPNVFTPNADGSNDVFTIYMPYATDLRIEIYDRWGVLVSKWAGLNGFWDGTYMANGSPCVDGVYYYILDVSDLNHHWSSQSGFVELIRGGGN